MKFLAKREDSAILERELIYKDGGDNSQLKRLLLEEQKNFCAYTEKRVDGQRQPAQAQ